jgi:hypothetical protein
MRPRHHRRIENSNLGWKDFWRILAPGPELYLVGLPPYSNAISPHHFNWAPPRYCSTQSRHPIFSTLTLCSQFISPSAFNYSTKVSFEMASIMKHPLVLVLSVLVAFRVASQNIPDPVDWPGIGDLKSCVQKTLQDCFFGCSGPCIPCAVGCTSWLCACSNFQAAQNAVASSASQVCTSQGSATDIAAATSIFNAYCAAVLASPTGPTAPTEGAAVPANTGTTTMSIVSNTEGAGTGISPRSKTNYIKVLQLHQRQVAPHPSLVLPPVPLAVSLRVILPGPLLG